MGYADAAVWAVISHGEVIDMIYLDNAATTFCKPETVYEAVNDCLRNYCANPGRSGHRLAVEASRAVYDTRRSIAELFGIDDPLNVIFTGNGTEALNLAIHGLLQPGEHAVCTSMEHNSVLRPLCAMKNQGVGYTVVETGPRGILDVHRIEQAIQSNTRLLAVSHASNLTGIVNPLEELGNLCRRHGILFLVDAAQSAGSFPIDVKQMGIDFLAAPGHKGLFGIHGTGFLYVRPGIHLREQRQGGTGSRSSSLEQPDFLPDRYESGTLNLPGIVSLGTGVEFIQKVGVDKILDWERHLMAALLEGLLGLDGIYVYGDTDYRKRLPVAVFNIMGYTSAEAADILDKEYDICVRPGLHCAPLAHRSLGTGPSGAVRMSLSYFTTKEEVGLALDACREMLQHRF